ncbi:MAG: hypothetical protein HY558_08480, partial [Euryarchaeota archaeon]|nr:hypothetical protein [Euryarchaeota archaeon]
MPGGRRGDGAGGHGAAGGEAAVPRHLFVEEALADQAYKDYPIGIGEGQTISQPYMVA